MKINMKDIADELNLSRTTVSLVLKGKGNQYRISQETQNKILKFVEEKQYQPNYFAQALNNKISRTIGIVFPDVFEEFMVEMIRGIEDTLSPQGYLMIIMTTRFSIENEERILNDLDYRGCDGILLVPTCNFSSEGADNNQTVFLEKNKSRTVLLDRTVERWEGYAVLQDDYSGGEYAAEYLKKAKCANFLTISFDLTASSIRSRLNGFTNILKDSEKIFINKRDRNSTDLLDSLKKYTAAKEISERNPLGIFVTTSGLALRVKEVLSDLGFTLNSDYIIIRFGSDPEGYSSGLTGIGQPHYEMGKKAASLMLDLIEKKTEIIQKKEILLPVKINQGI